VFLYDSATGEGLDQVGPCHIMSEPSFSPDGQWIVFTSTPVNMDTGEPGEPNLFCVLRTDGTDGYFLEGSPPRSDAAWGIVPGSAPPPPDRTPPTIEFRPEPSADGWLDASAAGEVDIVATDDRSPPSVVCTDNGEPLSLSTESSGSTTDAVATLAEGYHHIDCRATDGAGYSTSGSATYQVDLTPPTVPRPYVSPTVARVGETVFLAGAVIDYGSRVHSVDARVVGLGEIPPSAWNYWENYASFTASLVPTRPDFSWVVVSGRDKAGWAAESAAPLVSYDPSAGTTDGTGWIVPGGATSESGDVLPGLDGARRASFGFTAKYRTPSSVAPAGTLTFSYGNRFKLQSRQLSWLAVRDRGTAYLGGFASIQGMDGEFPFVAVIIDGTPSASADRFELRVYEPGTDIASPTPLFAASGDAGGQIQIRS
jgi:hypothetical protein